MSSTRKLQLRRKAWWRNRFSGVREVIVSKNEVSSIPTLASVADRAGFVSN